MCEQNGTVTISTDQGGKNAKKRMCSVPSVVALEQLVVSGQYTVEAAPPQVVHEAATIAKRLKEAAVSQVMLLACTNSN